MMTILSKKSRWLLLVCVFFSFCYAHAQWKMVKQHDATYATYVTKSGKILLSDFQPDKSGGIYISEDEGETWKKTDVSDHNYSKFYEAGDYLFAIGYGTCLARSADEGKTWTELSYYDAVKNLISEEEKPYTACYAIAYHKGKLYIGDFLRAGILYSEDFGNTWKSTDLESLQYESTGSSEKGSIFTENIYQLVSYKDKLYAFGVYFVFCLDETDNTWKKVRDDSNFMAVSTIFKGTLLLGRSVMNYGFNVPFIITTEDGEEWGEIDRPENLDDNNIRVMASDEENIYVGLQIGGAYYTPNRGKDWFNITEGIPLLYPEQNIQGVYLSPLQMISTDKYVYLALYDVPGSKQPSGLYRIAKSDLPTLTSVEGVETGGSEVIVSGNTLHVNEEGLHSIDVIHADGLRETLHLVHGKADISSLKNGVYIYQFKQGNHVAKGKFVKS